MAVDVFVLENGKTKSSGRVTKRRDVVLTNRVRFNCWSVAASMKLYFVYPMLHLVNLHPHVLIYGLQECPNSLKTPESKGISWSPLRSPPICKKNADYKRRRRKRKEEVFIIREDVE
jgi:hypothetical protein